MKRIVILCLLACICCSLCACSKIDKLEDALMEDYDVDTLSRSEITDMEELFDISRSRYDIESVLSATHERRETSAMVIECHSRRDAKRLADDAEDDVLPYLRRIYSTKYSFSIARRGRIVIIGERETVKEVRKIYTKTNFTTKLFTFVAIYAIYGTICGIYTKKVGDNKGYEGTFGQGFWLGVFGVVKVNNLPPYDYGKSIVHNENSSASATNPQRTTPTSTVYQAAQNTAPQNSMPDGWQCSCGRTNARFISTCSCGMSKASVIAAAAPKAQPIDDAKAIEALKEYKDLLDSGIITQEEFDAKKKNLLGL